MGFRYAVGQAFEMNLEAAQAFTRNGHEIASHGYRCVFRGIQPDLTTERLLQSLI
jgi:hypothetical protein